MIWFQADPHELVMKLRVGKSQAWLSLKLFHIGVNPTQTSTSQKDLKIFTHISPRACSFIPLRHSKPSIFCFCYLSLDPSQGYPQENHPLLPMHTPKLALMFKKYVVQSTLKPISNMIKSQGKGPELAREMKTIVQTLKPLEILDNLLSLPLELGLGAKAIFFQITPYTLPPCKYPPCNNKPKAHFPCGNHPNSPKTIPHLSFLLNLYPCLLPRVGSPTMPTNFYTHHCLHIFLDKQPQTPLMLPLSPFINTYSCIALTPQETTTRS